VKSARWCTVLSDWRRRKHWTRHQWHSLGVQAGWRRTELSKYMAVQTVCRARLITNGRLVTWMYSYIQTAVPSPHSALRVSTAIFFSEFLSNACFSFRSLISQILSVHNAGCSRCLNTRRKQCFAVVWRYLRHLK